MRAELKIDEERLADPSKWPVDERGRRRCHLKSWEGRPTRFAVVYGDEPLTVWEFIPTTMQFHGEPVTYDSVQALVDDWMID